MKNVLFELALVTLLSGCPAVKESVERPVVVTIGDELGSECSVSVVADASPSQWRWKPCDKETGVRGCWRLALDGQALSQPPLFRAVDQERAELAVALLDEGKSTWFWLRDDASVLRALRQNTRSDRCVTYLEELRPNELRLGVRQQMATGKRAVHLAAVSRDGVQRVLFRGQPGEISTFTGRLRSLAPARTLELYESRDVLHDVLHDPASDPDQFAIGGVRPLELGDHVVFEVGRLGERALMIWDRARGSTPLRRYPLGSGRAAGNLGGDDDDIVWTEAEIRSEDGVFGETKIYTASAADPLRARKLGPDATRSVGGAPFTVGCKRAGHRSANGLALVDLTSGELTELRHPANARWGDIIGITCSDVYATTVTRGRTHLLRIPVQSVLPIE